MRKEHPYSFFAFVLVENKGKKKLPTEVLAAKAFALSGCNEPKYAYAIVKMILKNKRTK